MEYFGAETGISGVQMMVGKVRGHVEQAKKDAVFVMVTKGSLTSNLVSLGLLFVKMFNLKKKGFTGSSDPQNWDSEIKNWGQK